MPIDIEGWIEVRDKASNRWTGFEPIGKYMIMADSNSDYLFGISKIKLAKPIFGARGLPNDTSAEVEQYLNEYREFEHIESNFSFDELFGFSFVGYRELTESAAFGGVEESSGWCKVFRFMDGLLESGHDSNDIRLVVWASW